MGELILDNGVGRLLNLLINAKELEGNSKSHLCWCYLLNIDLDNSTKPEFWKKYSEAMELPDIAKLQIETHLSGTYNYKKYLSWYTNTRSAFDNHELKGSWVSFTNGITNGDLDSLGHAMNMLATQFSEEKIKVNDIKEIKDNILILIEEISDSKIDPKLKKFILEQLNNLHYCIQNYHINGIDFVEKTMKLLIGSFTSGAQEVNDLNKSDIGKKCTSFFAECFKKLIPITFRTSGEYLVAKITMMLSGDVEIIDDIQAEKNIVDGDIVELEIPNQHIDP
jgi:hypothetical protein